MATQDPVYLIMTDCKFSSDSNNYFCTFSATVFYCLDIGINAYSRYLRVRLINKEAQTASYIQNMAAFMVIEDIPKVFGNNLPMYFGCILAYFTTTKITVVYLISVAHIL